MSARMLSRSVGRDAARNGCTSSCWARVTRKSRSSGRARRTTTLTRSPPPSSAAATPDDEPGPERNAEEDQRQPDEHAGRDRLVEEQRAVRDREGRHDVGDERDARVAVERQHVEVDELRDRRAEDRRAPRRRRPPPSRAARRAAGRARTAGAAGRRSSMPPVASTGPGRVAKAELRVRPGAGVRERRQHDRERPRHRPPAAGQVDARQHPNADEPERDADPPDPRYVLVRAESAARRRTRRSAPSPARSRRPLESMCFSPQAMSQNGSAALNSPNTNVGRPAARSCDVDVGGAPRHDEEDEQQQPRARAPARTSSRWARGRRPRP